MKLNKYFCWMKLFLLKLNKYFCWQKLFLLKLNKYFCWMKIISCWTLQHLANHRRQFTLSNGQMIQEGNASLGLSKTEKEKWCLVYLHGGGQESVQFNLFPLNFLWTLLRHLPVKTINREKLRMHTAFESNSYNKLWEI